MSTGVTELLVILLIALLLFGPAIFLAWGGYMVGRRKGREEGAAEVRAEIGSAAGGSDEVVESAEESAEDAGPVEEDTDE